MVRRVVLIGVKLICAAIAIKAYQNPDSFYFTHMMAVYCLLMCLLILYYSWGDKVSRLIMVTMSAFAANNLYDEVFGDPLVFGFNEYVFGILIFINFTYQSIRLWSTRRTK